MIISGNQIQSVTKLYRDQTALGKTKNNGKTSGMQQSPDEVVLSSQSQEFGKYLQKLQSLSEVRDQDVSRLSKQVESGTYQVDALALAGRLMGQ